VAVCPADAVRFDSIDEQILSFNSFFLENDWLPHGEFETARLKKGWCAKR
jgi:hypothetical protein